MFDTVNRLLWCIPISNSAEKTTSIGNVLSQFTYNRLSPTRKIFRFHYNQGADPYPDKECPVAGKGSSEVSDGYLHTEVRKWAKIRN